MLREEQIDLRRQRARTSHLIIEKLGQKKNRVFSEYTVTNPETAGCYTVRLRGFELGDNRCTCPDFKSNTLGTCKHIEAVLESLQDDLPPQTRKKKAVVTEPEIDLAYGEEVKLRLALPARRSDQLERLARRFFNAKLEWSGQASLVDLIPAVRAVPEEVTVTADALEYIDLETERQEMARKEELWLLQLEDDSWAQPTLKVPLYDYQKRGAIFLACRGRAILADDMGLGKTLQTLAAVELLVQERGISRVLVVAPASVKYQWATEIERFTTRAVRVWEGDHDERSRLLSEPTFYLLVNYEQVVRQRDNLNDWQPDLVVLDEAQRIKNWEAKTSQAVKKLRSRYAFVLTGTPLENKLEELYSIVSFVDQRRFGPAFQFLYDHRVLDDEGKLVGYRKLDKIRDKLAPILMRRTRAEVLSELPPRTDNAILVELNDTQRQAYEEYNTALARLLGKSTLNDTDRKRLLALLVQLRTVCNGVADKETKTWHSPKLEELSELLPELLGAELKRKIVIFSQWETMLIAAAGVASRLGIGHVLLHGGLSGPARQTILERFRTDQTCRIFFSTDAGGVGLNLQQADTVINLELPWNPAVLEQRIARVHRLGQDRTVRVIHFLTRDSIEERVWQTLQTKQELFHGLFTGDDDELSFTDGTSGKFLKKLQELLDQQVSQISPKPISTGSISTELSSVQPTALVSLIEATVRLVLTQRLDPAEREAIRKLLQTTAQQLTSNAPGTQAN